MTGTEQLAEMVWKPHDVSVDSEWMVKRPEWTAKSLRTENGLSGSYLKILDQHRWNRRTALFSLPQPFGFCLEVFVRYLIFTVHTTWVVLSDSPHPGRKPFRWAKCPASRSLGYASYSTWPISNTSASLSTTSTCRWQPCEGGEKKMALCIMLVPLREVPRCW